MAAGSILEDEEENILYDLLINAEWPPETDTQVGRIYCLRFYQVTDSLLKCFYF